MAVTKLLLSLGLLLCLHGFSQTSNRVSVKPPKDDAHEELVNIDAENETIFEIHKKNRISNLLLKPEVWRLPNKISFKIRNATLQRYCETLTTKLPVSWYKDNQLYVVQLKERRNGKITGIVKDVLNNPLPNANIKVKGTGRFAAADSAGKFVIADLTFPAVLLITHADKQQAEERVDSSIHLEISLLNEPPLERATVIGYSDGYQNVSKEDATGSFTVVQMDDFKSNPNTNIIDRLRNVSLQTPLNNHSLEWAQPIPLRGFTTMYGNTRVPIVLDNFLLFVDPSFINPNDIDTIYQINDAAAATIWGTRSGNGVLVLKMRKPFDLLKGIYFSSRITMSGIPDPGYPGYISPSDYVDIEESSFRQGHIFSSVIRDQPVRDILTLESLGFISKTESEARLNFYRQQNIVKAIKDNFHQNAINQQYALNWSTAFKSVGLQGSLGYDRNRSYEKGNDLNRFTASLMASYQRKKITVLVNGYFSTINTTNNFINTSKAIPYLPLTDQKGNALPVGSPYSDGFLSSISPVKFLNWQQKPLEEARMADNTRRKAYYSLGAQVNYNLFRNFRLDLVYQHAAMDQNHRNMHSPGSFYSRDISNRYRQLIQDSAVYPVPLRGILDMDSARSEIDNLRLQFNYSLVKENKFEWSFIGGAELNHHNMSVSARRVYGDHPLYPQADIDYEKEFAMSLNPSAKSKIPKIAYGYDSTDYTESVYGSMHFNVGKRYLFSSSIRKDFSNRFAWHSNVTGMPLWSAGAAWNISKEDFYKLPELPGLKLRMSYGVTGNTDLTTMPLTSISEEIADPANPVYSVVSPANSQLTWEKIHMYNVGIDFFSAGRLITGSFDYYQKSGKDIVVMTRLNPTGGNDWIKRNAGSIKGNGFELTLQTKNIALPGNLSFATQFLYRFTKSEITAGESITQAAWKNVDAIYQPFTKGYAPDGMFGLRFGGLHHETGDPYGYLGDTLSRQYKSILDDTSRRNIVYIGPSNPTSFSSLALAFNWKSFSVAAFLNGRFGYFVRILPLSYTDLMEQRNAGTTAYYRRWQNPGDELHTNVPSLRFPLDPDRDRFYALSTEHTVRGDHIRLQRLQFSWFAEKKKWLRLPAKRLDVNLILSNLAILWKANRKGIDPDVPIGSYPAPKSITISINAHF